MTLPTAYEAECLNTLLPEVESRVHQLRQQVVELSDAPSGETVQRLVRLELAINDTLALLDVIVPPEPEENEDDGECEEGDK